MLPFRLVYSHRAVRVALFASILGFVVLPGGLSKNVAAASLAGFRVADQEGDLTEIRDKRRIALLIVKSSILDASGTDDPTIREALRSEPREALRYRFAYRVIAAKLNRYIRKHRSLQPVYETGQADFIAYFRLVEYRRLLNGFYPYGELFVIVGGQPGDVRPARIIWKTKKVMNAEDAIKNLVKELKQVRGER